MKVEHLIQAHRMLASWQQRAPADDAANAYGLVVLSIAPLVSRDECQERLGTVASTRDRQGRELDETRERLAGNALEKADLAKFEAMALSVGFLTAFEFVLSHLSTREGWWFADSPGSAGSAVHG